MQKKLCWVTAAVLIMVLTMSSGAWALSQDDGFRSAEKIESQYFTIYLGAGVNEEDLVRSLDISPTHKILAGQSLSNPDTLSSLVDALFIWAGSVLDMQLTNYQGNIKIARDAEELAAVYRKLYGVNNRGEKGFYIFEMNTLYTTAANVTKEILGHEIGHAIISNFFVVQPPEKVQEVLAGYIEYQLRKGIPRP